MPNPFTTPEAVNQSLNPPDTMADHGSNSLVMEEYAGENFPYRGIETHGVKPTVDPTDVPEWLTEGRVVPIAYVPANVEIDPVPVHIVNLGSDEERKWRTAVSYAGTVPSQVIGRNTARTSLKIQNLSTNPGTIYVSPDSSVSAFTGYPLVPGAYIELKSHEEVWAVSTVDNTILSVLWEYTVEVL